MTRLGSSSCLAELRLDSPHGGYARELDVSDCFYQFRVDEAGAWFGLDDPKTYDFWKAHGFEVEDIYDYRLGRRRPTTEAEVLYPVVSAMSMGWSWALFFANETVASIVRQSARGPGLELREKLPVPRLEDHHTASAAYVDNVSTLGLDYDKVQQRCLKLDDAFKQKGIPVVWSQEPVQVLETVGCQLDLLEGTLKNKSIRMWRVRLAGLELCRRGRVKISVIEAWLGHVTSLFRLMPCLMSVFDKIDRFTSLGRGARVSLWSSVRREIRQASHLVWMARAELRSPFVSQVDAGDSADHGYALMTRSLPDCWLRRLVKYREKWRFIALPSEVQEALDGGDRETLVNLIAAKSGVDPGLVLLQDESSVRYGLGIDTRYGQWLQHVLEDGDWLRTSALMSQQKARRRRRADVDWPALVEPVQQEVLRPDRFKL